MENDRKLIAALMSASFVIPAAVAAAALITDTFSSKTLFVVLMMFVMLPLAAAGAYMWATGKGQWAISGYNTMPKSRQEYYDAERMSRDVGKLVLATSLVLLAGLCSIFYLPHPTIVLILTVSFTVGICSVYAMRHHGGAYLKDPAKSPPPMTGEERKNLKIIAGISAVTVAVVLVVVFFFIGSGNVNVYLDDEKLSVDAPMVDTRVYYDDIVSVVIRDDVDLGMRIGGFGGTRVLSGNFNNDEFGDYTLASYKSVRTHIVLEPNDGKILVFNQESVDETVSLFEDLRDRLHPE
ncbi:MAG: DUF3784 domain-containing protein [Candidatus Methanoplasma sp.]|jgi:flagellar basal body-associated protein FliL|nr:DUF3784 domain-containing protein [Candidatus Methanoplasma sp.]